MKLEKLKLSGFKSFVDTTTLVFPSYLSAVVGPNGCGKSNTIDAIRWVMGESSAKQLRGESLVDVIFNGSTERKPVGQAMVELVFDNSDGSVGGEYANYSQIAIKRTVDRNSHSIYYLNGSRCRRKDIMDIFLGTGLGPRSYSIIEQGMISRFVEANPEDLRVFFEEAAGVSKYKERRRETENRIKHTRENLTRVTDICKELEQQSERLGKQASDAKTYQTLRQQERELKAQLLALRWKNLDKKAQKKQQKIVSDAVIQEKLLAEQRTLENQLEQGHTAHAEVSVKVGTIQQQYHSLDKAIARLEENIRSAKLRRQQLQTEANRAAEDITSAQQHLADTQQQLTNKQASTAEMQRLHTEAQQQLTQCNEALAQAEKNKQAWQQRWDDYTTRSAKSSQQAQVEQTRIQHIEQQALACHKRIEKLQQEQRQIDIEKAQQALTILQTQTAQLAKEEQAAQQAFNHISEQLQQQRETVKSAELAFDHSKQQLHQRTAEKAKLEAQQQAALRQTDNPASQWLNQQELSHLPRLAQNMQVKNGWEVAVETVLASYLQAIVVEEWQSLEQAIGQFSRGEFTLVAQQGSHASATTAKSHHLLAHVTTDVPLLQNYLSNIYAVESLAEALKRLETLTDQESIVTRDGIWLNRHWLRIDKGQAETTGVLKRESQLRELAETIQQQQVQLNEHEKNLIQAREKSQQMENEREQQRTTLNDRHRRYTAQQAQQQSRQDALQTEQNRLQKIDAEMAEQRTEQSQLSEQLEQVRQQWQQALAAMEQNNQEKQQLLSDKEVTSQAYHECRTQQQVQQEQVHRQAADRQAHAVQCNALQESLDRDQKRISVLEARTVELQQTLSTSVGPTDELEQQLQVKLNQHVQIDQQRQAIQSEMQALNDRMSGYTQQLKVAQINLQTIQSQLEQTRMQQQELSVRATTVEESLTELSIDLNDVLGTLPEEAQENLWDRRLRDTQKKIEALGPINLAAIDEFSAAQERKTYLNSQYDDLTRALEMLEQAIAKIDRESKQLFRETYQAVKENFSRLFPRLFGGGKATLELTDNDWLTTGISILAQPPGKKNNSIHLLSGGEKALTAVALIFAIFQLNPSPFCLLDEVDAPLDDANVARFCQLVKEMSEQVQFIIITHNKVTMELAEHLTGVTMREPGVSRIVSVGMQAALSLAEAVEG